MEIYQLLKNKYFGYVLKNYSLKSLYGKKYNKKKKWINQKIY